MADLVTVDVSHALEDLTHVVPDFIHRNGLVLVLVVLDHVFKVGRAELKDHVLHTLALISVAVVNVE